MDREENSHPYFFFGTSIFGVDTKIIGIKNDDLGKRDETITQEVCLRVPQTRWNCR